MSELDELCRMALDVWGEDAQMTMPMEEMGELISALSQYKRNRIGDEEVAEEIADVKICLRQLEMMVGEDVVEQQFEYKKQRLEEKLNNA